MRLKILLVVIIVCVLSNIVFAQTQTLKEQALELFKNENYPQAISLLEKAVKQTPTDPELFYYLGFFTHYNAYDSRPLKGYDYKISERIFNYLQKAIELKPDYGDAKYFYGAECSANYFISMQRYDAQKLKLYAQKAFDIGAYPKWLVEWGRNFLNTLEPNAIVFTGGNADFDICLYLQVCEGFRIDVTVIPIGNIDRPWYVEFLKQGLKNSIRSVDISLTKEQIFDIHMFKWRSVTLELPVTNELKKKYNLPAKHTMDWLIEPDLVSGRVHLKIEGDSAIKRSYLSPQRAILLHIVEQNGWKRPIYFSNGCNSFFLAGLDEYIQNWGLVSKLLPMKKDSKYEFDYDAISSLLNENNLKHYRDIIENDIPRISGSTAMMYHRMFINLATHYKKTNNKTKLADLVALYNKHLQIGFDSNYEKEVLRNLRK